ncbi:MAG TPA: bifunctional pyr operon transcriptional regulator/uracil phosphoribosyltransferase PyrR [Ktedonobacterales bacterium]|nr:bifunctional pyr operon transcriptional regulator/uracil phosphoribosyltransferase PyrR [Ktedonobacterales bacterium]
MSGAWSAAGGAGADGGEKIIFTDVELRRAISRIAHEIVERNGGAADLTLLGLRRRGGPLAKRLAERIHELEGIEPPVAELDVTDYRDDLPDRDARSASRAERREPLPVEVVGRVVVLVDDVLFTGRTARAGLEAVLDHGRPRRIQLAVMVDRGHRELPIRADYVGKNVPTAMSERIAVRLLETDDCDAVALIHRSDQDD